MGNSKHFKRVRGFVFITAILALFVFGALTACSDPKSKGTADYEFEGLDDIHISDTVTEYDFNKGVVALADLEETEFTVDSDGVTFGTAGSYKAVYKIGDYTKERNVYIYGKPTIARVSAEIDYESAASGKLAGIVKAEDTFGNALTAQVEKGLQNGTYGFLEYGEQTVKFSATDKAGNKSELECKVTVSDNDVPVIPDIEIDLADVETPVHIESYTISRLFTLNGGGTLTELESSDYTFINKYLTFAPDFITTKELGTYTLKAITPVGYCDVNLKITDEKPANFSFYTTDVDYSDTVSFDVAKLIGYQRDISFEYTVTDGGGLPYDTAIDGGKVSFTPGLAQSFTVTAKAKRGSADAGSKTCKLAVHDDVYAWTVNANDDYDGKVYFFEGHTAAYDATKSFDESVNGSLHITNNNANGQDVAVKLWNMKTVAARSSFYFYVYNPMGIELTSDMYTTNGYWVNQPGILGVVADRVTIPAEKGWHKVVLTLKDGFDGTFGSFPYGPEDELYVAIRVMSADGQYSGSEKFNVFVSNIYLETQRGESLVNYGDFIANVAINTPAELPKATSADGRVHFEYTLKDATNADVTFDESTFTFTPATAGMHKFIVKSFFRNTKIAEKEYSINVSDGVVLPVQSVYSFGADKKVMLPAAIPEPDDARYYVKDGSGTKTVLGSDRVFTAPDTGDYVYGVEYTDGTAKTKEENIKLRDSRILFDCSDFGGTLDKGTAGAVYPVSSQYIAPVTLAINTEKAAPGETKSLEVSKSADCWDKHPGERVIGLDNLIGTITGKTKLIFWMYLDETSISPFTILLYFDGWDAAHKIVNYTVDGVPYTEINEAENTGFVSGANGKWSKIEVDLTNGSGNPITVNEWAFLYFRTDPWASRDPLGNGYPWAGSDSFYLSSFYFDDSYPEYTFNGLDDIKIKSDVSTYNFENGVSVLKDGTAIDFTVDSSSVTFGTAGEYTVTYKAENQTKTRKVYIYGDPVFTTPNGTSVPFAVAFDNNDKLADFVRAEDTFGKALEVRVEQGFTLDDGYIEYGEKQTVRFSATDTVGNKKEFSAELTVSDEGRPVFNDVICQATDTEAQTDLATESIYKIFVVNEGSKTELTVGTDYNFADNKLTFTEAFIGSSNSSRNLLIVTPQGYGNIAFTVSGVRPVEFTFALSDIDYAEKVTFAAAELNDPSEENVTVEYTVTDKSGNTYAVTKEADGSLSFMPGSAYAFTVKAQAKRNGEDAGSKVAKMSLHDDVYAWTVKPNADDNDVTVDTINTASLDTRSYGDYNGSLKIVSDQIAKGEIGSGKVGIRAIDWQTIQPTDSLCFYIYNPTGVQLTSYIYTNVPYWVNTTGGILTQRATISAETGWQKVSLKSAFDGNFPGLKGEGFYTEIRIFSDGERYNGDETHTDPFTVYVSNIYLQVDRDKSLVSYDDAGFSETVKPDAVCNLPKGSSTEKRVRFEYTLTTKDGEPETFDTDAFTFTKSTTGEYVFSIKSYFRDVLLDEKTYSIFVTELELTLNSSYTFDETRVVALPEATLPSEYAGKTVTYELIDGSGQNVAGTPSAFTNVDTGDYRYRVTVKDGDTVIDYLEKTVKLRSEQIAFDCSGYNGEVTEAAGGAIFSRNATLTLTTDKAAPGETKSLKVYRDSGNVGERSIELNGSMDNIVGKSKLIFWIYLDETSTTPFTVRLNSGSGLRYNFTVDGAQYGQSNDETNTGFVEGKNGKWSKVVFDLTDGAGNGVTGNWATLSIQTNSWAEWGGYPWTGAKEFYLSSFYFE